MLQLLPKEKVASFDVDAQKGFTPLCPNELPVAAGDTIVSELNAQAKYAAFRVGSKDAHAPNAIWVASLDKPQFSAIAGKNVDIRWNLHCVPGTPGFELLDGLPHPSAYNYFVYKGIEPDMHPYGACYHDLQDTQSTGVIEALKVAGIRQVIVGGLALDYCVKTTVIQLVRAGFEVIINLGSCRGIDTASSESALAEMEQLGVKTVNSSKDLKNENV